MWTRWGGSSRGKKKTFEILGQERIPILSFFWGDPSPYIAQAHAAGSKVFHQVGSVEAAQGVAHAGVDMIIAQDVEAGRHIAGEVTAMVLVPEWLTQ